MTIFWMFKRLTLLVSLLTVLVACGAGAPEDKPLPTEIEIAKLADGLMALGPNIDPAEAERAARIAYQHTRTLAIQYQITDPPLVHNTKVNMGLRPRGLCWHWAEDMQKRFNAEKFETLSVHRAIANATNWRIEHSTAILSPAGGGPFDGLVIDPWRLGGTLTYHPTDTDPDYEWLPQAVVHAQKREAILAERRRAGAN